MNKDTKKLVKELKGNNYYSLNEDQIITLVSTLEYNESYQKNLREAQYRLNARIRELEGQVKEFQEAMEGDDPSLRTKALRESVEEDFKKWRKSFFMNSVERRYREKYHLDGYAKQAYLAYLEKMAMGREKDKLAQRIGRQRKVNKEMHQEIRRLTRALLFFKQKFGKPKNLILGDPTNRAWEDDAALVLLDALGTLEEKTDGHAGT